MPNGTPRAIGIFDSGVGGLTVLDECRAALPAETFVYFGDTALFPYGDRSAAEVRRRALAIGRWLVGERVKLIVIACNTATAVAVADLQRALPAPVIGVIQAEVRAAVRATRSGRIGLLATEATVRSGSYARLIGALDAGVQLTSVACPRLAPAIQAGDAFGPAGIEMVAGYTAPLTAAGVDTVILGCTHYTMIEGLLRQALPGVALIDGRREIAQEVVETLDRKGIRAHEGEGGSTRFGCSGDPDDFRRLGRRFLNAPLAAVDVIDPDPRGSDPGGTHPGVATSSAASEDTGG